MNRRDFLQRLAMTASALAIDPERLLWTPRQKTIFIPSAGIVVMQDGLLPDVWKWAPRTAGHDARFYHTLLLS